jgi:hypothetical protein
LAGFGPDEGIPGVRGGRFQADWNHLAEIYENGPDPTGRIPAGLVPIYDWGCTIWSLVDFRDPVGLAPSEGDRLDLRDE